MKKIFTRIVLIAFFAIISNVSYGQAAEGGEEYAYVIVQEKNNYAIVYTTIGSSPTEIKEFDFAQKTTSLYENMDIITPELELVSKMGFSLYDTYMSYRNSSSTTPYMTYTYLFIKK